MHDEPASLTENELGVSAIEFAIFAPVLFTCLTAIINIGLIISAKANLENRVYTASNYAMFTGQGEDNLSDFRIKIENIIEAKTTNSLITGPYSPTIIFLDNANPQTECDDNSTDCAVFMSISVSAPINALPIPKFVIKEISTNSYVRIR